MSQDEFVAVLEQFFEENVAHQAWENAPFADMASSTSADGECAQ